MSNHVDHVRSLEKQITALSNALAHLGKGTDLAELIRIIRFPGYTTPAEWALHVAILDSMQTHVNSLTTLSSQLLAAGKLITSSNEVGR